MNAVGFSGKTAVILLPVFNDWESVFSLLPLIDAQLTSLEIKGRAVIINDGSTEPRPSGCDSSLEFKSIQRVDELVLTHNLGHQQALACAIGHTADQAAVDFIIVMDADHEDNPVYIPDLVQNAAAAGTIIFAERTRRSEGPVFKMMYWFYQRIFRLITGADIRIGNYCVIPGGLLGPVAHLSGLWTHFPAAIMRSRLPFAALPAERGRRIHGKGKMLLTSLITHGFGGFWLHADIFAARTLIAAGILSVLLVLAAAGILSWNTYYEGAAVTRWTFISFTMLAVMLVQIIGFAVSIMFLAALARSQLPSAPIRAYSDFILETRRLL